MYGNAVFNAGTKMFVLNKIHAGAETQIPFRSESKTEQQVAGLNTKAAVGSFKPLHHHCRFTFIISDSTLSQISFVGFLVTTRYPDGFLHISFESFTCPSSVKLTRNKNLSAASFSHHSFSQFLPSWTQQVEVWWASRLNPSVWIFYFVFFFTYWVS